jgi:hypothetical protein
MTELIAAGGCAGDGPQRFVCLLPSKIGILAGYRLLPVVVNPLMPYEL